MCTPRLVLSQNQQRVKGQRVGYYVYTFHSDIYWEHLDRDSSADYTIFWLYGFEM